MDDVVQGDNVSMLQVLQERDLSDGSAGSSFLMLKTDLLQSNKLASDTEGGGGRIQLLVILGGREEFQALSAFTWLTCCVL